MTINLKDQKNCKSSLKAEFDISVLGDWSQEILAILVENFWEKENLQDKTEVVLFR